MSYLGTDASLVVPISLEFDVDSIMTAYRISLVCYLLAMMKRAKILRWRRIRLSVIKRFTWRHRRLSASIY